MSWKWNGCGDVEVLGVVESMNLECPEKPRSTGASYESIARQWLRQIPVEVLKNRRYSKRQLGEQLSLTEIRKSFGYRYTVDGKTQRWMEWFMENYPLWSEISKGNNITGKVTEVMIQFDVLQALSEVKPAEIMSAWLQEVENLVAKNPDADYQQTEILIDLDNLQRYIYNTEDELQYKTGAQRHQMQINLAEAKIVEGFAIAHNHPITCELTGKTRWFVPQVYRDHPVFHRRYFTTSINLQSMHSKLREVIVGRGYSVDINTSVYTFYKRMADYAGIADTSIITEMMDNKRRFRADIGEALQNTYEWKRAHVVKTAITALGFGATTANYGGIDKIIRNGEDLKAFNAHPKVIALKQFMRQLTDYIRDNYKDDVKELGEDFRMGRGYNYKKFLAKLYQNYETLVMQELQAELERQGKETVLWVHDGLYVRGKFDSVALQHTLQQINPYASLEITAIEPWSATRRSDILESEMTHQQRMYQEEQRAQQWAQSNHTSSDMSPSQTVAALRMKNPELYLNSMNKSTNTVYDGSGYSGNCYTGDIEEQQRTAAIAEITNLRKENTDD